MKNFLDYRKTASLNKIEKKGPGRPMGKRPCKAELKKLYIAEGKSIRDIARILGCSKDIIFRSLHEYKFISRSHIKPSKLDQYSLDLLREKIKEKGYKHTASDFGIHRTTLLRFVKKKEREKQTKMG
ncbi:hypothetical protein ACFLRM_02480 [Acidobacteriota bacterium]